VQPVVVRAGDGGALVVVVRVVGADLHGLVRRAPQHREERVGELQEGFQRDPGEPREVAVALGAVEGVGRGSRAQQYVAGALQPVAEIRPAFTV
jgi:hypothetical protein